MCLAVPGRVAEWIDRDPLMASAKIEFAGIKRLCHLACVPDAEVGDYVLVHAGVAIAKLDPLAAQKLLDDLKAIEGESTSDWEPQS